MVIFNTQLARNKVALSLIEIDTAILQIIIKHSPLSSPGQ